MTKGKKDKKSNIRPFEGSNAEYRHARLFKSMIESAAWREIDTNAAYVYTMFKFKFDGNNQEEIVFTYSEARKMMARKMTDKTFTKSIDQLIKNGFITIKEHWSYYQHKQPTVYSFSDMWKLYGQDSFKVQERVVIKRDKRPKD